MPSKYTSLSYLLILSEVTLLELIWHCVLGRNPGVLAVRCYYSGFDPIFKIFVEWLGSLNRVCDIQKCRPDLVSGGEYEDFMRHNDSYAKIEPWIDQYFNIDNSDSEFGRYAYAYKHLVVNSANILPFLAATILKITDASSVPIHRISGIGPDLAEIYPIWNKKPPPANIKLTPDLNWLVNGLFCLVVMISSFVWIVRRIKVSSKAQEKYFLGCDFVGDPRQTIMWDELSDGEGGTIVLLRNEQQRSAHSDLLQKWPCCNVKHGYIPVLETTIFLKIAISDIFTLWRRGRHLSPEYFWSLIKLPMWRLYYKALLKRYKFRNFFGRDDYNSEHIIRDQELKSAGVSHFGLLHGLPAYPPVLAQRRYLSFNTYYVFGPDWHQQFHMDRWPRTMTVKDVGSFGMSRDQLNRLSHPRPKNILVFIKHCFQDDKMFAALPKIAAAFPDRKVVVKAKQQRGGQFRRKLDKLFQEGPSNLLESDEDSYQLMFDAQYILSDPSTMVIEPIQFGLISFCFVPDSRWGNLYFRQYGHLCLENAEQAIDRIQELEEGSWRYPRESYAGLINLSGNIVWDEIRKDMGLTPKQTNPLSHLAFVTPRS